MSRVQGKCFQNVNIAEYCADARSCMLMDTSLKVYRQNDKIFFVLAFAALISEVYAFEYNTYLNVPL